MITRYGLSPKTIDSIQGVLTSHREVEQAVLFGSRAKGNYRRGSDIDLALLGTTVNQQTLNRLYQELDELPIPYEFSLVPFAGITDRDVRAHVERVGIVFYNRDRPVPAIPR
jgi:predicted nucleotidyltransferase